MNDGDDLRAIHEYVYGKPKTEAERRHERRGRISVIAMVLLAVVPVIDAFGSGVPRWIGLAYIVAAPAVGGYGLYHWRKRGKFARAAGRI